jgi:hypothetical protein
MRDAEPTTRATSPESLTEGFRESLPLLVASILLFATGIVSWIRGIYVGPNQYPLAEVLIALGFVAAIGAVLSWFFAGASFQEPRPSGTAKTEGGTVAPTEPEGRPRPHVSVEPTPLPLPVAAETPPWDEGPKTAPEAQTDPMAALAHHPEAQMTLAELDQIEAEVSARRVRPLGGFERRD